MRRNETSGQFIPGRAFGYYVNLDERGEFYADVRDEKGKTVWETYGEVFEDGYMRDKRDIDGLRDYMIELGIMRAADELTNGE